MKLRPFLLPTLLILAVVMIFTIFSCTKSNNSKPSISIKSIDMHIKVGQTFTATFDFTDASSKMSDGYFVAIRTRLNQTPLDSTALPEDTFSAGIPTFPDQRTGQIQFTEPYNNMHESDRVDDTMTFQFAAINRNGISSDTIISPKIIVEK